MGSTTSSPGGSMAPFGGPMPPMGGLRSPEGEGGSTGSTLHTILHLIKEVVPMVVELFRKPPKRPTEFTAPPGKSKEEMIREAQAFLGIDCINRYNIAICGPAGVGKSSFINRILGKRARDPGAAPVGDTETTMVPTKYDVPHSALTLIDVPGGCTERFTAASYVEDTKLYGADAVIIMYADRVYEVCNDIVRGCESFGVPVCFVRNKADSMLDNLRRNEGLSPVEAKERARRLVDQEVLEAAPKAGFIRRFIISNYNMDDGRDPLDFPQLAEFLSTSAARRNRV